jgi:hypothetical protein
MVTFGRRMDGKKRKLSSSTLIRWWWWLWHI